MRLLNNRNAASVLPSAANSRSLRGSTALTGGVVAAMLVFSPLGAEAQVVWNGATNTDALTGTNWVGNTAPGAGNQAQLNTAGGNQPTLGGATTYTGLGISDGTYTVGAAGSLTSPVTLSGTGNLSIQAGGSVTGLVTAGGASVSNIGTIVGNLVITAGTFANSGTVTGTTSISGGILNLNGGTNLADGQLLTVSGTATLAVNAGEAVGALTQTGGTIQGASILTVGTFTQSGGEVAAGVAVNSTGQQTLQGGIIAGTLGGAGATTIQTGITTVSGTIFGNVTVDGAGTLRIASSNAIAGTITTTGSTVSYANGVNEGSPLIISSPTTNLEVLAADVATQSGVISSTGAFGFAKIGNGTLTLTGANSYSGVTTITAGTLQVGAGGAVGTLGTGNVVNNATLTFNRSDAITVGNAISGTGALNQNGAGNLTLGGVLSYGGVTTVNSGALTLTNGGNTINGGIVINGVATRLVIGASGAAGTGTITTNGSVISYANGVNNAAPININSNTTQLEVLAGTATQSGVISETAGPRPLEKIGAGTLILTGANTYTGVTTISAGTLQVGNANALGPAGVARFEVNGGSTLDLGGNTVNAFSGLVQGGSTLSNGSLGIGANSPTALQLGGSTISANLTGIGGVTAAFGNNVFSGANTYSGVTTITAGILEIGNGGATGTLGSGNVVNNATLQFNRSDAITVANVISGTGAVTQIGGGTATLTGTNTYSGTTTVTAGTLQVGAGGTVGTLGTGNVVNNSTLVFNRSDAVTIANVISGNGTTNHIGTGATTLSGNSAVFAGITNVNAGQLLVTGALGGVVNVNAGGLLGGTGTVGVAGQSVSINAGGILAPGLSPGTLTIAGNLALAAGSITNFELNTSQQIGGVGATGNDLINVGGNLAVSAGAVLNVGPAVTGYYRLFNVTGAGAATSVNFIVNPPAGSTASIYSIVAAPSQVNLLLNNGGQSLQFWDGADQAGATAGAQGGASTWNAANTNWTQNPGGVINDSWRSGVGVFLGTAGTVTVNGAQSFQGLQFSTTGYIVDGPGTLNLTGNPFGNAAASFLNIDGGVITTINAAITGNAGIGLDKLGTGTLVLAGANTYSGLTTVTAGTLNLAATGTLAGAVLNNASFNNAGAVAGGLTNNAGATNSGTINGGVINNAAATLASTGTINGGLTNSGSTTASGIIAGGITNTGSFTVSGPLDNSGGNVTNNAPGTITLGAGTTFTNIATFANSAAAANAVLVNAGASLSAATLRNLAGTFTNLGTVTAPVLSNAGTLTNSGTVTSATSFTNTGTTGNTGTMSAAALVNSGTLTTSGTLSGITSFSNSGTVNASGIFNSAAANNTGVFTVQGNLAGATTAFSNQAGGLVNLAGGNFTGIGAFNNAGTFQSTSGAARTLGAGTFNNQATGVINLANGSVTDQLTITGAYAGTAGSQVQVDIDLSRQDAGVRADRVVVVGAGSGASTIAFNIINPNRTVFGTPIEVMTTGAGSVAVNEGEIVAARRGFFGYFLRREAAGAGSSYQVVSRFNSGPVAGVASGITGMISSLQAGFHQPASAIISRPDNCQPNQLMGGPFIRMSGGETTVKNTTTGDVAGGGSAFSGASKSATRFSGVQTGADIGVCNINNTGWNVHTGIMGGVVETTTSGLSRTPDPSGGTFSQTRTTAKVEVPFIGAYMFATNGAFTSEINVRKDFYNAKISAFDPASGLSFVGPGQKLKGNGLNFNASFSYRFSFAESWYIEPQVGFSKGTTSFSALPFSNSTADFMTFRKSDSMLGRVGLNMGTAVQATENLVVVPFVSAAIWHEFAKPTKAQAVFGSNGNQTFDVQTDRVGTFGQVGAGLQFRLLNTPFVGFIRADARFGSKIEGKALNAGLRMQF